MFDNLIESKRAQEKRLGGTATSVMIHVLVIGGVLAATANAGLQQMQTARQEDIKFVEVPKNEPPPPEPQKAPPPPPPDVVAAPPPPKGFQVLTAPVNIPDKLPEIDLTKSVTDEADFSGRGVAGGTAKGVEGGTPQAVNTDQPYFEFQVEKPVLPRENNPTPTYPSMLLSAGIAGEVLAQFVVDQQGRVEMGTLKILKSTNEQFSNAVRNVLPRMRFYPAEVGGRQVKQLVQMPFVFNVQR